VRVVVAACVVAGVVLPVAGAKGVGPTTLAVGEGAVWVGFGDGSVRRLDPATRRSGGPVWRNRARGAGPSVKSLAVGFGFVWVATGEVDLVRIEPRTGGVRELFRHAGGWTPSLVEVGAGAVWIGDYDRNVVYRYDPRRQRVTHALAVPGRLLQIATGPAGVWAVVAPRAGRLTGPVGLRLVLRLYPRRSQPIRVRCDQWMAVGTNAVWLSDLCSRARLARVDARTGRIVRSRRIGGAARLALAFGSLWLVGETVTRVDPRDLRTVATTRTTGYTAAAGFGRLWVLTSYGAGAVTVVDPRTNGVVGR
jgi:streptogramin lyase